MMQWITDIKAEYLGFASYPPVYLRQDTKGKNLLIGANIASAGSGYYDRTAQFYLTYYKEYQNKVVRMVGKANANIMFSGGIHPVSAGTKPASVTSDILMRSYSAFVQNLYGLGVRRIGVTTLPPMTSQDLQNKLPGLKLVVFDIYQPLLDLVTKPTDSGFFESRKACCGTGTIETSMLCNARTVGTCSNATQYVFWDGCHPSEAANQILAQGLLEQGFSLIS
ncbi:Triacylglycerol lipase [Bertholletia excelsa]